ncbi:MAG: M42 family metallopeptidase [Anaerolineales bacterium]|nr:M42 family metallopeptidase [Anaerolineales bacterium]MDW8226314.1 M42 family metallopeptidase [Anaerolineales bacterium]
MKPLIQKLTETFSPSGYETAIREAIRREVEPLADEIRIDPLGSLIVRKGTKNQNGKRIMIAAHMDEIGLMVTHIDENGFVRFTGIGGIRPQVLTGSRVRFVNGAAGVIGVERLTDLTKAPTLEQCFIDVGATSKKDCPVKVGDVCGFERPFLDLDKRLVAKAMDDRIGCAVAIEALRALQDTPHELYFVFTTQEEVGVRGATASAFGVDPDVGLAVDVTATGDTPKSSKMEVSLGKGPAVKVKDAGMLADPRVVDWMIRTAEKAKIPYQREVLEGGSTDARAIQLTRAGVPAGCLSIPCRYVHTPSEMVDYDDVQNAVRLLTALLSHPFDL